MTPQDDAPRGAALDASGAQLGDVNAGAVVGGDLRLGASADDLQGFLMSYIWEKNQQDDIEREYTRRKIATIRLELWLWRIVAIGAIMVWLAQGT